MLVQPKSLPGARKVETAFFPVATDAWLVAPLGQHVTFALSNVEVRTRTVAVAFFVVARLEARDMRFHHARAHYHKGVGTASSATLPFVERKLLDVGDKVRLPDPTTVKLRLGVKVVRLAGVAIVEIVGIVEDKILAGPLAQELRQVGH